MSQYERLFATCRVPTDVSARDGLCDALRWTSRIALDLWLTAFSTGAVWRFTPTVDISLYSAAVNSVSRTRFVQIESSRSLADPAADWFDCLDSKNRPLLNDREILSNLQAIVKDADKTPVQQVGCFHPRIAERVLPIADSSRHRSPRMLWGS
jgi:hypothetical protein